MCTEIAIRLETMSVDTSKPRYSFQDSLCVGIGNERQGTGLIRIPTR